MGRKTFSVAAYAAATRTYVPESGPATRFAEQTARKTGKLNPLVDPAEYGVIRRSLPRFEERSDGLFELTVGTPMPIETRLDTTGSMGGNVDVALKVLPDLYKLCGDVLPGYDIHVATGIFGDVVDRFVLCRPQFEMLPEKIVEQLTLMVPERAGGDMPEDPHYGIFGGAYLVSAYVNRIGLKRYDFTVSDAPAHDRLSERTLMRVFGDDVFDKVAANGFTIDRNDLPSNVDVVKDLLDQAHAFFLQVRIGYYGDDRTTRFWEDIYGKDRVVVLPDTRLLPQVQAAIIGLTEGTLGLDDVTDFLRRANVPKDDAKRIARSVANIPIGAAAADRRNVRVPAKGDLFAAKPDVAAGTGLWPIDPSDAPQSETAHDPAPAGGPGWL